MRIVHCFRSPVGGIFRHVRDLVDAQVASGHEVGIVCDSSTGGEYEEQLFEGVKAKLSLGLHRVAMQRHIGPGDIVAAWRTFKIIKGLHPDILHGHGAKGGVYSRLFGSALRVFRSRAARFYSPHGGSLHYDSDAMTGKLFFGIERLLERLSDHLLFVSEYERQTYEIKVQPPRVAYSVIYNGLQDAEFDPRVPSASASDFLFIGMMRDLKGPDIFIDALAKAGKDATRPLTAAMVGAGDDLEKYKLQAKALGLGGQISFHPPLPARQAFNMARCIAVPSRAEAMPYIVLEALAAGMPMAASAVGGIPEIFGSGSYALIQPDSDELAAKMREFISSPGLLMAAMPSVSSLKSNFSARVMAARIEAAYRTAAPGAQTSR
jgi:glycosyltransferase involved in cell wall biosynthesis